MGELSTIDFDHLAATVQNALEASGAVLFAVLGLDISLNDERQKGLGLGWNPHYHGFALTNDAPHLLRVLQAAYPPSVYVHAPIDLGSYDRSVYATSYAFKPVPYRRVSYFDANHYPYPCWNTRHTSLKAREHVEFLLHARELGFARRLILHRVAVTNSNGFLTMKKHE